MDNLPSLGRDWLDTAKPKLAYMDLETFSPVELKKHGARRYAEQAEILLWLWADGDGDPQCRDATLGEAMPSELSRILHDPEYLLVFHNGLGFDVPVIEKDMGIVIPPERVWDTMHQALTLSLPGSLDKLGKVLGLPEKFRKKAYGKDLIHLFCKPRDFCHSLSKDAFPTKAAYDQAMNSLRQSWSGRATRLTHPQDWKAFIDYGLGDIEAMRGCFERMPRHNLGKEERKVWYLDSKINNRGILIDTDLCHAAIRATDREQARLRDRVQDLTDGEVGAATQRDALLAFFLAKYDLTLDDLTKATVGRMLDRDDLPDVVRELLEIRQRASKSSTAKYKKILDCVSSDERLRGTLLFCGASRTGRWSGKNVQPHNLPQPKRGGRPMGKKEIKAGLLDMMADATKSDCIEMLAPDVMEACSAMIRGAIVAGQGNKLTICDLAGIEARVLPWLAGERGVIEAFHAYDRGEGSDQYKVAYGKMFGVDPSTVQDHQRQTGKVIALATQFLGGVGAIVAMALLTKTDIETQIAALAYGTLPEHIKQEAEGMWEWALEREAKRAQKRKKIRALMEPLEGLPDKKDEIKALKKRLARLGDPTFGLSAKAYVTCDGLKRLWREGNPATVRFWGELEDAVRNAINHPGQVYEVGNMLVPDPDRPILRVAKKGTMTWIQLPSGRRLYYPHLSVRRTDDEDEDDEGNRSTLMYMGVNSLTKQWTWIRTHKGVLAENCLAADTKVVTQRGCIPIVDVTSDDLVWDGEHWVRTAGCVNKGAHKVGKWLGVTLTGDHPIFDGANWFPVSCMGALKGLPKKCLTWARDSTTKSEFRWGALPDKPWEFCSFPNKVKVRKGVWKKMKEVKQVYDLLNCGPNKRFTIVTDAGPVVVHNCTQAVARDVLANGMLEVENAGYPIILTVHDEILAEVPDDPRWNVKDMAALMCKAPAWAKGLPLAAEGFETYRYRKG